MALMLRELYKALLDAGVSDDQASKAAAEVAQYENRLAKIGADLGLLKWMVGTHVGLTILGFTLLANWLWQVLQRLPMKP
jgi:hypothetical protein